MKRKQIKKWENLAMDNLAQDHIGIYGKFYIRDLEDAVKGVNVGRTVKRLRASTDKTRRKLCWGDDYSPSAPEDYVYPASGSVSPSEEAEEL